MVVCGAFVLLNKTAIVGSRRLDPTYGTTCRRFFGLVRGDGLGRASRHGESCRPSARSKSVGAAFAQSAFRELQVAAGFFRAAEPLAQRPQAERPRTLPASCGQRFLERLLGIHGVAGFERADAPRFHVNRAVAPGVVGEVVLGRVHAASGAASPRRRPRPSGTGSGPALPTAAVRRSCRSCGSAANWRSVSTSRPACSVSPFSSADERGVVRPARLVRAAELRRSASGTHPSLAPSAPCGTTRAGRRTCTPRPSP